MDVAGFAAGKENSMVIVEPISAALAAEFFRLEGTSDATTCGRCRGKEG